MNLRELADMQEEDGRQRYAQPLPPAAAPIASFMPGFQGATGISATPWYDQGILGSEITPMSFVNALPLAGAMLGTGLTAATGPGAVAAAGLGGAGGESLRQLITRALAGAGRAPQTPQDAASAIGTQALWQAVGEATGQMLPTRGALKSEITAYHGSPREFEAFSLDAPKTTLGGLNRYGVSVSPDMKVAQRYASDFGGSTGKIYTVDATVRKPLELTAQKFERLQSLVSKIDTGKPLTESEAIDVESILGSGGVKWAEKEHPIQAIRDAGFDAISKDAGRHGIAEREMLVFDPANIKILKRE